MKLQNKSDVYRQEIREKKKKMKPCHYCQSPGRYLGKKSKVKYRCDSCTKRMCRGEVLNVA